MTTHPFRAAALAGRNRRLHGELRLDVSPGYAALTALLVASLVGLSVYAATAGYAARHEAVGHLVPVEGAIPVHAYGDGHVEQVHVTDGARVAAGEALASVRRAHHGADGADTDRAGAAALQGEKANLAEHRRVLERTSAIERASMDTELASLEARRALLVDAQGVARELAAVAARAHDSAAELVARTLISRLELDALRAEWLAARHRVIEAEHEITRVDGKIGTLQHRLRQHEDAFRREALALDSQHSALQREWLALSARGDSMVVAPAAGRVTALQAVAGAPLSSRPLLFLMPEASELEAHLYVDSAAVGHVAPGQPVRLALDAWDPRHHGWQQGRVRTVSATALLPAEAGVPWLGPQPLYRVTVALQRPYVEIDGQHHPLQPGSRVHAHVALERRSLLGWLAAPLLGWRDVG